MKKYFFFLLFAITAVLPAKSQLLYKCESPAGDTVTWIMGTMHWTSREGFREDPIFDSLIAASDVFFEEPLLREHMTTRQIEQMNRAQRYEGGKTLADFFSKKELKRLTAELAAEFRVNAITVRRYFIYAPFFMLSKLPPRDSTKHLELDNYLIDKAKAYKRKIVPLDHPDSIYQTSLILRDKHQPDWLIRAYPGYFKRTLELEQAYRAQDTAVILRQVGSNVDAGYNLLIKRRNEQWEKIIDKESGERNFIEAGLAHVIATGDGLLDFFRRKNWRVSGLPLNIFTRDN